MLYPRFIQHWPTTLSTGAFLLLLGGCASLGKVMSPYSETFSCKNSDHGQCIDPSQAHADAVAGNRSSSNPAATRDKALLSHHGKSIRRAGRSKAAAYSSYQDSVYRELQGLIDAPETPMLRQGRTVRTLILPYADRGRPDRLYMPRFVYSILERPQWVVGDYLVSHASDASRSPVLYQVQERSAAPIDDQISAPEAQATTAPLPTEVQP